MFLRYEGAAEVQPSVARLCDVPWYVRLRPGRAHEVAHLVAARVEELGDQPAVALRPRRLGAHQSGCRLGERGIERVLPALRRHPRRVGPKACDVNAAVAIFAGLT